MLLVQIAERHDIGQDMVEGRDAGLPCPPAETQGEFNQFTEPLNLPLPVCKNGFRLLTTRRFVRGSTMSVLAFHAHLLTCLALNVSCSPVGYRRSARPIRRV